MGWSVSRVGRADNSAKSAARSACFVGGRLIIHVTKCALAERNGTEAFKYGFRSRTRQPGAVSVEKSLGQQRGVERTASWPRRQPRQVRSAYVLCGRSASSPFDEAHASRAPRN